MKMVKFKRQRGGYNAVIVMKTNKKTSRTSSLLDAKVDKIFQNKYEKLFCRKSFLELANTQSYLEKQLRAT